VQPAGAAGGGGPAGPLDFLRTNPQFQALRAIVQSHPAILQPMLQARAPDRRQHCGSPAARVGADLLSLDGCVRRRACEFRRGARGAALPGTPACVFTASLRLVLNSTQRACLVSALPAVLQAPQAGCPTARRNAVSSCCAVVMRSPAAVPR